MPQKVALVTGGARRIGRAIVEHLADTGWAVGIHCHRSRAEADTLAQEIARRGGAAVVVEADLREVDAVRSILPATVDRLGPPSLLINNAAMFERDSITDLDPSVWQAQMAVNLRAPCLLAGDFAAALAPSREGLVVNILDQRVRKLTPAFFSYTLAKSALWTATQTMAQGLAPRIRVNAIAPGPTLIGPRQDEADFLRQRDATLLGSGPNLNEFGATITYLWQNRSITGQMIALDGGQHLVWQTPDATIRE